jgi:AraC-like DNA-binding protein
MDQWQQVNAVQRMQDYIRSHITESVTLLELARQAGYSPFHSARMFKELTGRSPFEYMRQLRLTKAALMLRDENVRVLDVALDFVFDSHEGFTRAFSKEFGITPHRYQKSPPPIRLFLPSNVREYYTYLKRGGLKMDKDQKTGFVFVQVIDRPARKVILKRGIKAADYFAYCEEVGCDVWGILCSVKEALYEPIGMWLPMRFRKEGTSEYAQGVEVPATYSGEVPEGYDVMDLPPCRMMVFQGPPFDNAEFCDAIEELSSAMDNYNPELYGFVWADEDGPRFQLEPQGYRGYIEARPVRNAAVRDK